MGLPKFSFSPPQPFSRDELKRIMEKLEALEREVLLIKRKVAELEGKNAPAVSFRPEHAPRNVSKPTPAAEARIVLLDRVDVGNVRVIETVLDWVQFLLSKVGQEGIDDLINYYVEIGWISEEVADLLRRYARGMRVESSQGYMLPEDHAKSLDYITRVKEAMR